MSESSWSVYFLLLILLLGGLDQVRSAPGDADSFQRVYQTEETVRQGKAQEMRRHMNQSADPCMDFYEYACGNWKSDETPRLKLEKRIDLQLLRLLDEPAHGTDNTLVRQAKEFYKSCHAAKSQQDQKQQQFLNEFIQQNGGFPAVPGSNWPVYHPGYDWLQVIAKLRRNYGMDILIGTRISYNYANVQENSIYLSEPTTLLPRELCIRTRKDVGEEPYEAIMQLVAKELKTWLAMGNDESVRLAAEIVSFEREICGAMQGLEPWDADLRLYKTNYTRKTLPELGGIYGMDLEGYVTTSFSQKFYRPVYMAAHDYYQQLKRTVDAHNVTQLANYIMYRAVATITFPLDDKAESRPAYCLAIVKRLLPSALGTLYDHQYRSKESQEQLHLLYDQLKDALQQSLANDWLEEGSQRIAKQKLSYLRVMQPNYNKTLVLKLELNRNNYWHNLRQLLEQVQLKELNRLFEEGQPQPTDQIEAYQVRVLYRPVQQRIELGWALLQSPDYDERYGHALQYATLGTALAQQMVRAFDEMHWSVGLRERDFWDGLTAWRYRNRSTCFTRHVEEYLQANDSATAELISDSAGLSVAFHAYLTWLDFQEPNNDFTRLTKETLPGLNYPNTALFFIAFAQQHCNRREHPENDLVDPLPAFTYSIRQHHSWTRLRVNGPLRNLPHFAREFRCPAGTPMNPAEKCIIY